MTKLNGRYAKRNHFKGTDMTGNELRQWRGRLNLNKTGMALQLKTPRGTYVKWENEQRRVPGIIEPAMMWIEFKLTGKIKKRS